MPINNEYRYQGKPCSVKTADTLSLPLRAALNGKKITRVEGKITTSSYKLSLRILAIVLLILFPPLLIISCFSLLAKKICIKSKVPTELLNKISEKKPDKISTAVDPIITNTPNLPTTPPKLLPKPPESSPLSHNNKFKEEAEAFLAWINTSPGDNEKFIALKTQDLLNKFTCVVQACPFENTKTSKSQLEEFVNCLKLFKYHDLLQQLIIKLEAKGLDIPIPSWRRRHQIEGDIVKIQRKETPTRENGKNLADVAPVNCVVIKGLDGAYFGVKIVSPEEPNSMVVVINQNGIDKEVCVNENELLDRLLLEKLNAQCAICRGRLSELFEQEHTVQVLLNFQRIFEKQQKLNPPQALSPNLLIGVIATAFKNRKGDPVSKRGSSLNDMWGDREIAAGFREDKIYLHDITKKTLLAEGGQAKIFTISAIPSAKERVMKSSNLRDDAKNEIAILDSLHKGYPAKEGEKSEVPGILKPFYGIIPGERLLQKKYSGDLQQALGIKPLVNTQAEKKNLFSNLIEKLTAIYPVLLGFDYCYTQKGLFHGDIKTANILYSKNPITGKIQLFLGDFGSAELFPGTNFLPTKFDAPWTAPFVLLQDKEARTTMGRSCYDNPTERKKQEYKEFCHKWDVFAMGCVLADVLMPEVKAMEYTDGGYPHPDSFKRDLFDKAKLPKELVDLVQDMLRSDPTKRPNSTQVVERFAEILKNYAE